MASRTLTLSQWLKLVGRHALGDQFAHVAGFTVADVARKLGVARQRAYQLVDEGTLDTLVITNSEGRTVLTLVTEASLERYLAERVPDRGRQGYFAFHS